MDFKCYGYLTITICLLLGLTYVGFNINESCYYKQCDPYYPFMPNDLSYVDKCFKSSKDWSCAVQHDYNLNSHTGCLYESESIHRYEKDICKKGRKIAYLFITIISIIWIFVNIYRCLALFKKTRSPRSSFEHIDNNSEQNDTDDEYIDLP
jgi:hypothetical protein